MQLSRKLILTKYNSFKYNLYKPIMKNMCRLIKQKANYTEYTRFMIIKENAKLCS